MESVDSPGFVRTQALTVAVMAVDTDVEGVEVTSLIVVGRFHPSVGVANVLEQAGRLDPSLLPAPHAESIVMLSVASLDLMNGSSSVQARHCPEAWVIRKVRVWD